MGGAGIAKLDSEPDQTSLAIAEHVFNREITGQEICDIIPLPDGWRADYTIASTEEPDRGVVTLDGIIFGPGDGFAGVIVRDFCRYDDGTMVVFHQRLYLYPPYKRTGFSRTAVLQAPTRYKALGFEEVRLVAAEEGRFVWARLGFDWRTKSTRDTKRREFESFLSQAYSGMSYAQLEEYAEEATVSAEHLASSEDEEGKPIGKIFLLEETTSAWEAVLRLK